MVKLNGINWVWDADNPVSFMPGSPKREAHPSAIERYVKHHDNSSQLLGKSYQSPLAMTVRLGQGAIYRIADTNTFPNRHVTVQAWRIGEFLRAGHNSTSYPGGHPSTTSLAALHIAIRFSHEMVSTRLGESWLVSGSVVERCWMFSAT